MCIATYVNHESKNKNKLTLNNSQKVKYTKRRKKIIYNEIVSLKMVGHCTIKAGKTYIVKKYLWSKAGVNNRVLLIGGFYS